MATFNIKLPVSQILLNEILAKLVKNKKLALFVYNAVADYVKTPKGRALYSVLVGEELLEVANKRICSI